MSNAVSVIIPTWNRGDTILGAIRSALEQSHPVREVLVCDDGSTDGSEAIVHALSDFRVKWLPGAHGGMPAVPRNRGVEASESEWIAFLDSDDRWSPEKLECQIAIAERGGFQ